MLERVTDTFIAGVELLEAEGRAVKHSAARLLSGSVLLIGSSTLAAIGLVAGMVGLTLIIARATSLPEALVIVGAMMAVIFAVLAFWAYHHLHGSTKP